MQNKINQRQQLQRSSTFRVLTVIAGALLAAVGLELFLMPHGLVVGGITGLSALFAHTTEMQLGLFLFLFNLPFIFMSRKQVNLRFALYTVLGLTCLTIASLALHRFPAVISDPLPAAMAGGICLGVGIGISVRFGGVNKQASDQVFSAERRTSKVNGSRYYDPELCNSAFCRYIVRLGASNVFYYCLPAGFRRCSYLTTGIIPLPHCLDYQQPMFGHSASNRKLPKPRSCDC